MSKRSAAMVDDGDWGPYGRPLLDDPDARALARVGVVDIGSNSVRLVVFDGAARSPAYFFNEKVMAGLGAGVTQTGRLNPEGRARALKALIRFARLAEGMGAAPLTVVATAAMREAEDGPAFQAEIEAKTGLRVQVIDGQEEARLSAQGVLLGWPGATGLVCDIGGASMEMAALNGDTVGARMTTPLGPLHLHPLAGSKKALKAEIEAHVRPLVERFGPRPDRLFLVGGSWRAIARVDMVRSGYPLHVLHEYRMTPEAAEATISFIGKTSVDDLRRQTGIGEARMELVPMAAHVLRHLIRHFAPRDIAISSYGIREGMLYDKMSPALRARDPLIEAARAAEQNDARIPGFGKALFDFVQPLFKSAGARRQRLVTAACLLHDVTWRAHPDYRHEACFDYATRANLGGLTHGERVFLGLALLHRYKNSRSGTALEQLLTLLTPDEIQAAEVLGKAMRFGAMFTADRPGSLGTLDWQPTKQRLCLSLTPAAEDLFGEVAEARFLSLAAALDAEIDITRRAA